MWYLHGDEQQNRIAQMQPCNVHEMLQRMVQIFSFRVKKLLFFMALLINAFFLTHDDLA